MCAASPGSSPDWPGDMTTRCVRLTTAINTLECGRVCRIGGGEREIADHAKPNRSVAELIEDLKYTNGDETVGAHDGLGRFGQCHQLLSCGAAAVDASVPTPKQAADGELVSPHLLAPAVCSIDRRAGCRRAGDAGDPSISARDEVGRPPATERDVVQRDRVHRERDWPVHRNYRPAVGSVLSGEVHRWTFAP